MMQNMNLSLEPLFQRRVFRSDKKVDCHFQVTNELSEHEICWKGNNVDTELFKARIHRLEIFMLKYGAEVVITPEPFQNFVLVHMTMKGVAEIESDRQKISIRENQAAVLSPQKSLRMWWQAGSEQLILKIPVGLFDEIRMPEKTPGEAIPSVHLLPPTAMLHWNYLMQSLLGVLNLPGKANGKANWIDHVERSAVQFLSDQFSEFPAQAACESEIISHTSLEALSGSSAVCRLDALEQYIWKKLSAPVSLNDLANAAGVSVRWLNVLCQQQHGIAPMVLLRNKRLDAARTKLISCPEAKITDTAFEFGFGHLGRFSAYYQERFGELPRVTQLLHHGGIKASSRHAIEMD
jgi:AraC-like DNA-binding protein